MAGIDERQAFAKLEALKDIRHKTISLEKTRVALLCDVGQMEEEERCLNEYRYSQVIVRCIFNTIEQTLRPRQSDFCKVKNSVKMSRAMKVKTNFSLIIK